VSNLTSIIGKPELLVVNDFHPETIKFLDRQYSTHHFWKSGAAEKQQLINDLQGKCTAVATASWDCDPLIYELESLRLISAFGVGVDGIDFERTAAQGIQVSNTPDVLDDAVADLAVALILNCTRNLINAESFARTGEWNKGPFQFGHSLAGKTLGIAGLGRIGQAIAARAAPFKLNIAYHNRNKKDVPYTFCSSLTELAEISDILLCMLPGGEETRNVINAEVLAALGKQSYFVNVGRGSSVDEEALLHALKTGAIAGAGLDVYKNEPHIPDGYADLKNVVLLPHIGSATVETRRAMGQLVIDNLAAHFAGNSLLTEVRS